MQSDTIECKPTMWFTGRALVMALMFLGFGAYFYYDAVSGYPRKNLEYFMHKTFVDAGALFDREGRLNGAGSGEWERTVQSRMVEFPEDYEIPAGVDRKGTPWPAVLADYDLMSAPGKGWSAAWQAYSAERQYPLKPVEQPYDGSKIFEQWVAGSICMALAAAALFLLVRTRGRKMALEDGRVSAAGRQFRVEDIARLDLRRWKMKGLAHAVLKPECGKARVRLDGLTYGGFRKEDSPNNAGDAHAGRHVERRKDGKAGLRKHGSPGGVLHVNVQPGGILAAFQFNGRAGIVGHRQPHVIGLPGEEGLLFRNDFDRYLGQGAGSPQQVQHHECENMFHRD